MPTVAVSTYSFGPECTAVQGIEFAARHGFRGMELGSWTLWPEVTSRADRRTVRTVAAANGIDLSIHFIHRGVAPASHDPARRARHMAELRATLDLAHDIGVRPIVIHPGPIDRAGVEPADATEAIRREAVDYLVDFLRAAAPAAEDAGAVLCVENLFHTPGMVVQSYQELVDVVEAVEGPAVAITLDFGHADRSDGLRPAFETFAPHLRHIHVHDSARDRDHREVGRGAINFKEHLDAMETYPFTMAIESRDESDPEGCVLRSRDHLMALLGPAGR